MVGGGVAGCSCALALARKAAGVLLIEETPAARWKIGETLGPASRPALQALGVWEEFAQAGHLPCHGIASAWGWEGLAAKDFIFTLHGSGWQLDRASFESLLIAAVERSGARVHRGRPVEQVARDGGGWRVALGAESFSAKWLIDATGRRAMVARKAGAKREVLDQLVSIHRVAVSASGADRDSRTFIESSVDGWWYSTLTPGGRRTLSFQTDADLLPGQTWRTADWFEMRLRQTRHIARLVEGHGYVFHQMPQSISAHTGRLEQVGGEGWIAVGDAAISYDPLSGHGLVHALQSGIAAAGALTTADTATPHPSYGVSVERLWASFRDSRRDFYRMEKRFPDSSFWQRRQD